MSIVKDISLYKSGDAKIEWVKRHMPLLNYIEKDFEKTKPFEGLNITISIHVEAKTAYMARVLKAGGAKVTVTGCNPLSTQDDVAAALLHGDNGRYAPPRKGKTRRAAFPDDFRKRRALQAPF